ncbi:hypothetical protein [Pedobacter alluvionis]|uniref:Uncharacterized protein n=1 Tax=Pedobacter alluvionis TaxID=475253 RepID=A0A497YJ46_9SPHI|nr:hypothetical protein [Pedobacter alluvionis]RLJ80230.1 hypothetical protein BCL90_0981 [Pedobacter alluvionis]TFB31510.1 hypothetical protein E3V97_13030 [Pedobacter alluvionis]
MLSKLSLTSFADEVNARYSFTQHEHAVESRFETLETKFAASPDNVSPSEESVDFTGNNAGFEAQMDDAKNYSKASTDCAEEIFSAVKNSNGSRYSSFYAKYKDVVDKIIKKGYKETAGKLVTEFFDMIGVDFPFLDKFIDPIINEPIVAYIQAKTEKIFKYAATDQGEKADAEMKNVAPEFTEQFSQTINNSSKFSELESAVSADLSRSARLSEITKAQLRTEVARADAHLKIICTESRWEGLRRQFSQLLKDGEDFGSFTNEQLNHFNDNLKAWEDFKNNHKVEWYLSRENNIEDLFYTYSRDKATMKACWGVILQQLDFDKAGYYFSIISPEKGVIAKPYNLLRYYYGSTGKISQMNTLYDDATDNAVGIVCPPH